MTRRPLFLLVLAALGAAIPSAHAQSRRITVSAAADLARAFPEIAAQFTRKTGIAVDLNFASTRKLATQIEQGAAVDVFAAADRPTVEQLDQKGLTAPGTVQTYAYGRLVLCVPPGSKLRLKQLSDLAGPEVQRISIANPDHAPYGRAAREALQGAGLWNQVGGKVVPGDNVQQALQYVETGNVDAGLVALSLVQKSKVRWTLVPERAHRPIEQTLCVVRSTKCEADARKFVAFVTREGRPVLARYGFQLPGAKKR